MPGESLTRNSALIRQMNESVPIKMRAVSTQEIVMSENTTRGRAQDRAKVAGGQQHEVRYESDKTGASKEAVRQSVKDVGNSRRKVESDLKKK